jgi:hypothetical protein
MNYQYDVYTYFENSRIVVETNDVTQAISALMDSAEIGRRCDVVDGITGEVYVSVNSGDNWCVAEWALMINGWLMQQIWGV